MKKRTTVRNGFIASGRSDSERFPVGTSKSNTVSSSFTELYPYGYSANPPASSGVTLFEVLDNSKHLVGIPYEPDTRFKNLNPGEVQLGNQTTGSSIKFSNDGQMITITNGNNTITVDGDMNITVSGEVSINAPQVTINGDLRVSGSVTDNYNTNTKTMSDMRTAYNAHAHISNGNGNLTDPTDTPV